MDDDSRERVKELIDGFLSICVTLESWRTPPSESISNDLKLDIQPQNEDQALNNPERSFNHIEGLAKFRRRIHAELDFLKSLESGETKFKREHLLCSNLSHYAAIVDRIKQEGLENVNAVAKIFRFPSPASQSASTGKSSSASSQPLKTEIDIICRNRACWIKVKAMSAEGVSAVVNGTAAGTHKSVLELADEVLDAARYNLVHYQPPAVVFHFSRGVSRKVASALKKKGIFIEGDFVETPIADFEETSDEEHECLEKDDLEANNDIAVEEEALALDQTELLKVTSRDISIVNLDVTTLITMVSDLTNGFETENFDDGVLEQQALDERKHRTMPELEAFFAGKELIATDMAVEKFLNIVSIVGGPREQQRAQETLKRLRIVPNSPSPELQSLRAPKVKDQHRIIFGTGHALKATTTTANTAFAGTAKSNGLFLSVHFHPARALTEQKAAQYRASHPAPDAPNSS